MRQLIFCDPNGSCFVVSAPDDSMLLTPTGRVRADSLSGSTPATVTVPGTVSPDGDVLYTARHGGEIGNSYRVAHVGSPGSALLIQVDGNDVTVVFDSDAPPTAQQVVDAVSGDTDAAELVIAAITGDGSGEIAALGLTALSGGIDDGDCVKWDGVVPVVVRCINTVEVI